MSVTGIIFKCPEAPGRNWNGWLVVIYTGTHSTVFVWHGRNIRAASIGCAVRLDKLDLAELEVLRAGNVGPRMLISSSSWEQTPTGNLNAAATPNLRPKQSIFIVRHRVICPSIMLLVSHLLCVSRASSWPADTQVAKNCYYLII